MSAPSKALIDIQGKTDSSLLLQKPKKCSKYPGPGFTSQPTASSALARVRAFLPQIASANEKLSKAEPGELDIENIENEDAQCIEMNIAMVQRLSDSESDSSDSEETDTEEGATSQNEEPPLLGPVTESNIKLTKSPKSKPCIEVLSANNVPPK